MAIISKKKLKFEIGDRTLSEVLSGDFLLSDSSVKSQMGITPFDFQLPTALIQYGCANWFCPTYWKRGFQRCAD